MEGLNDTGHWIARLAGRYFLLHLPRGTQSPAKLVHDTDSVDSTLFTSNRVAFRSHSLVDRTISSWLSVFYLQSQLPVPVLLANLASSEPRIYFSRPTLRLISVAWIRDLQRHGSQHLHEIASIPHLLPWTAVTSYSMRHHSLPDSMLETDHACSSILLAASQD